MFLTHPGLPLQKPFFAKALFAASWKTGQTIMIKQRGQSTQKVDPESHPQIQLKNIQKGRKTKLGLEDQGPAGRLLAVCH